MGKEWGYMGKRDELAVNRPWFCSVCGGEMKPLYAGIYECKECKKQEYDDFGKVRAYIEEHGKQPAAILAEETGVAVETIEMFLRTGRLEIPEGSDIYISCERCGCDIRYGRFCGDCMKVLTGDMKRAFFNEAVGEKPKLSSGKKTTGKMHTIDWIEKRKN